MKKPLFGFKEFVFIALLLGVFTYLATLFLKEVLTHVSFNDKKLFLFIVIIFLFIIFSLIAEAYISRPASKWHFDQLSEEEKDRAKGIDRIITVDDLFKIRLDLEIESREKSKQLVIAEQKKMLQG